MGSFEVCNFYRIKGLALIIGLSMPEHPESFPVNALVPIPGTPLEGNEVCIPFIVDAYKAEMYHSRFVITLWFAQ